MGKKESKRKALVGQTNSNSRPRTIREEITGKRESDVKGLNDVNGVLRLKHLQNIATWAGGEAKSPSFGAYFGYQLATSREALGIKLSNDASLVYCQRCEAILQPGSNCTVRIERNVDKGRRKKKRIATAQNSVVYTCLFCSHRNMKRGTAKGHMKKLAVSTPKSITKEAKESASVSTRSFQRNAASLRENSVSVFSEKMSASANATADSGSSRRDAKIAAEPKGCKEEVASSVSYTQCGLGEQAQQLQASTGIGTEEGLSKADANSLPEANGSNKDACSTGTDTAPLGRTLGESSGKRKNKKKTGSNTLAVGATSINQECEASSRQKRKSSWSSLKELAHEEQNKRQQYGHLSGVAIPFSL